MECCRYGMLDPSLKDKEGLPLTIRAVFIVGKPQIATFPVTPSPGLLTCHQCYQPS